MNLLNFSYLFVSERFFFYSWHNSKKFWFKKTEKKDFTLSVNIYFRILHHFQKQGKVLEFKFKNWENLGQYFSI